jgi:DNA-binding NarL/FixJ family response regulator
VAAVFRFQDGVASSAGAVAITRAIHEGESHMRVFVVEDSPAIRERLVEIINEINGLEVVGVAATYIEAVSGIRRTRPDVGIFDIQLAEGSGIDALAAVKRELPALRGVVLSNYATPQHRRASIEAGAEYFLDKSADFERIAGILAAMHAGEAPTER